jgi:hypothetical protein
MKLLKQIIKNLDQLDELHSSYIKVRNIQNAFGVNKRLAYVLLETAKRFGYFHPSYIVHCPLYKRIVGQYRFKHEIPGQIECGACEECISLGTFSTHHKNVRIEKVYRYGLS